MHRSPSLLFALVDIAPLIAAVPAFGGRAPSVYIRSVTSSNPVHDLSKLRIDRDPPPEVRRAFGRTLALIILGLLIAGGLFWLRSRSVASVQTVVATPISSGGGGGA